MGGNRNYYYAVQKGKQQGVFSTWDECKANVNGFSGAKYKKFNTMEEAQAFVSQSSSSSSLSNKFSNNNNNNNNDYYSSASSNYSSFREPSSNSWYTSSISTTTPSLPSANNSLSVTPATFTTISQRRANYQPQTGVNSPSIATKRKLPVDSDDHAYQHSKSSTTTTDQHYSPAPPKAKLIKTETKTIKTEGQSDSKGKWHVVYTDGACRGNGRKSAKAGYGVWWGDGDPRNLSGPLDGHHQTNQRAEATAIMKVLEQTKNMGDQIEIHTDSQYCIKAMTEWNKKWIKKEWKTSTGGEVQNRDLFEPMLELVKSRKGETKFVYVAGHTGVYGNEQADALAVAGAQSIGVKKEKKGA